MTDVTAEQKLECAKRELAMRKRVYPRWVESGNMSPIKAAHEIACMEAITRGDSNDPRHATAPRNPHQAP